jgi:hypothetical protein
MNTLVTNIVENVGNVAIAIDPFVKSQPNFLISLAVLNGFMGLLFMRGTGNGEKLMTAMYISVTLCCIVGIVHPETVKAVFTYVCATSLFSFIIWTNRNFLNIAIKLTFLTAMIMSFVYLIR